MRKGLVSIIMPVFNGGAYLEDAVRSVLMQDYSEWELLIVDNGSTDNSPELLRSFKDERIAVLYEPERGVSAARNKALANITGEYFCFLDCDDCYTPGSISARVALFSREPALRFADGRVSIRDEGMEKELRQWSPGYAGKPLELLLDHSEKVFFGPTWMFRNDPKLTYRFHTALSNGEDLFFYIQYANEGNYGFIRETILNYRVRPGQASSNLRGMEMGYRISGEALCQLPHVSRSGRRRFKRKAWQITWKSYLKAGKPQDAIRVMLDPAFAP